MKIYVKLRIAQFKNFSLYASQLQLVGIAMKKVMKPQLKTMFVMYE